MSWEISFSSESEPWESFQLGTASGVAQLSEWATSLRPEVYPELVHLFNFGWVDGLRELRGQIKHAIESVPPEPDVVQTAVHLVGLLRGWDDGVAMIGDHGEC